jgi:xanthine dehydrogenase YagR molybdenum-binding subunit
MHHEIALAHKTQASPEFGYPAGQLGSRSPETDIRVEAAAHEMGMGTATVQTQVISERLGFPIEKVTKMRRPHDRCYHPHSLNR